MSYEEKAERIRNKLSGYQKSSMLIEILGYLHSPEKDSYESTRKMPWLSFLLIEWLYQVSEKPHSRKATPREVRNILNEMWGLQSEAIKLEDSDNIHLSLRVMFIGQMATQIPKEIHLFRLFRNYSLLSEINRSTNFEASFRQKTGIALEDFFVLSLWLLTHFSLLKNNSSIKFERLIINLTPHYSIETIVAFVKIVGVGVTELESLLSPMKSNSIRRESYFMESNLFNKPVIIFDDVITTPHRALVGSAISDFSHKTLKDSNSNKFKTKYGKSFEGYVREVIGDHLGELVTENDILRLYESRSIEGKVVDFIVKKGESTIFIDSKGIEPHRKFMAFTNQKMLKDRIGKTFWHGVIQAYGCASIIENSGILDIAQYENRYALVITNRNFYISSGEWISENISPELFDKLVEKYGRQIPPENILVVSIEDFEGLSMTCNEMNTGLEDFIDFRKQQDSSVETRKFDIRQHIEEYRKSLGASIGVPIGSDSVMRCKEVIFDKLAECIKNNEEFWTKGGVKYLPKYAISYEELKRGLGLNPDRQLSKLAARYMSIR